MNKLKELSKDPEKFEAALKEIWNKFDTKKQGWVTHEEFRSISLELTKASGEQVKSMPSDEERNKIKQLVDPEGTGKVNFDGFVKLAKLGAEKGTQYAS